MPISSLPTPNLLYSSQQYHLIRSRVLLSLEKDSDALNTQTNVRVFLFSWSWNWFLEEKYNPLNYLNEEQMALLHTITCNLFASVTSVISLPRVIPPQLFVLQISLFYGHVAPNSRQKRITSSYCKLFLRCKWLKCMWHHSCFKLDKFFGCSCRIDKHCTAYRLLWWLILQ